MAKKDEEFKCEIVEHLCDLGDANEKGWKKELNLIKWNGGEENFSKSPYQRLHYT